MKHVHCSDVIMSAMASQITSLTIVYSTVFSGPDQRKRQSSVSLAFVRRIHQWPVNSPHKGPVTRKCFHLMTSSCAEPSLLGLAFGSGTLSWSQVSETRLNIFIGILGPAILTVYIPYCLVRRFDIYIYIYIYTQLGSHQVQKYNNKQYRHWINHCAVKCEHCQIFSFAFGFPQ